MTARRHRLIVDGMNVIGSRPDGWWRDREAAVRALVGRLQRLAAAGDLEVTAVLDGRPLPDLPEGDHDSVRVLYGERGRRDAADDRIVRLVESEGQEAPLEVVTSDRALAERVRQLGASVAGASTLLAQLDALEAQR